MGEILIQTKNTYKKKNIIKSVQNIYILLVSEILSGHHHTGDVVRVDYYTMCDFSIEYTQN